MSDRVELRGMAWTCGLTTACSCGRKLVTAIRDVRDGIEISVDPNFIVLRPPEWMQPTALAALVCLRCRRHALNQSELDIRAVGRELEIEAVKAEKLGANIVVHVFTLRPETGRRN